MAAGDYIKFLLRLQELHIKASELFGLNVYLNVPRTYFKNIMPCILYKNTLKINPRG